MQSLTIRASGVKGKQTVPRSELTAATMGMQFCTKGLKSDCKYVVDGANLLVQRMEQDLDLTDCKLMQGANVDLWMNFREVIARRGFNQVMKVKAHASIDMVATGEMTIQDFIGNHIADVIAKAAAKGSSMPSPSVANAIQERSNQLLRSNASSLHRGRMLDSKG